MTTAVVNAVSFGKRKKNTTVVKPVIIGTYAVMLSPRDIERRRSRNDNATHQWTCIVRSPTHEDMSYYVRRVVFNLHASFVNPQRAIERPPYEVAECGWGEFEIVAKIHFVDPNERPVELRHWLRLYPPGIDNYDTYRPPEGSANCVAVETCDEIIFNDPSERFFEILMSGSVNPLVHYAVEQHFLKTHGKEEYIAAIIAAQQTVNQNIEAAKAKIVDCTLEISRLKETYYAVHEDKAVGVLSSHHEQPSPPAAVKRESESTLGTNVGRSSIAPS